MPCLWEYIFNQRVATQRYLVYNFVCIWRNIHLANPLGKVFWFVKSVWQKNLPHYCPQDMRSSIQPPGKQVDSQIASISIEGGNTCQVRSFSVEQTSTNSNYCIENSIANFLKSNANRHPSCSKTGTMVIETCLIFFYVSHPSKIRLVVYWYIP